MRPSSQSPAPNPIRSRWSALLVMVTLLTALDIVLTRTGATQPLNESLTRWVYTLERPWLDLPMALLTLLGTAIPLGLIVIVIAVWAFLKGRRLAALLMVAAAITSQLVSEILKEALHQPRPMLWVPTYPIEMPQDFAYPSGHAISSIVVLGFGALLASDLTDHPRLRPAILLFAALLIAGIGFSRVYLGVHWVNDVVGGYLAGALILLAAYGILHRVQPLR